MKKLVRPIVLACLLASVLMIPAAAQGGPPEGEIWPFLPPDQTSTVTQGQPMKVIWAWIATTPGLVRVYLNGSEHTYNFYDEEDWDWDNMVPTGPSVYTITPDMAESGWGPLGSAPPEDAGVSCHRPRVSYSFWEFQLPIDPPALVAGNYVIEVKQNLRHPINDGFHTCTWLDTGDPASPPPSLYPRGESLLAAARVLVLPPTP